MFSVKNEHGIYNIYTTNCLVSFNSACVLILVGLCMFLAFGIAEIYQYFLRYVNCSQTVELLMTLGGMFNTSDTYFITVNCVFCSQVCCFAEA